MTKKTYEVTGNTPYMDTQPGDTFEADLDEETEDRAIERGAIRVKTNRKGDKADA